MTHPTCQSTLMTRLQLSHLLSRARFSLPHPGSFHSGQGLSGQVKAPDVASHVPSDCLQFVFTAAATDIASPIATAATNDNGNDSHYHTTTTIATTTSDLTIIIHHRSNGDDEDDDSDTKDSTKTRAITMTTATTWRAIERRSHGLDATLKGEVGRGGGGGARS